MKLMVTGASGKLGRLVVEHLTTRVAPDQITVAVRDPQRVADLAARGIDVRRADYEDGASLAAAFQGVDRLLLISTGGAQDPTLPRAEQTYVNDETRLRQHGLVVNAAESAGIGFIAYTSSPRAEDSEMFVAPVHAGTERMIRGTGIPFSFLRNNWYLENLAEELRIVQHVAGGGEVVTAAGDGRVCWAMRRDLAEAAATVLSGGVAADGMVYELGGAPASYGDIAAALSRILGRAVRTDHVDLDEYRRRVSSLVNPPATDPDVEAAFQDEVRRGLLDVRSDDLGHLLGRPPHSLEAGLRILLESFPPER